MKKNTVFKTATLKFLIILFCLFTGLLPKSKAQFFDELSNPQVTVNIAHPPGLGLKIQKVAFNPTTGSCSSQVGDAIIQDFVNNQVEVIDRNNLDAILAEHNFNMSGYVDRENAVKIGKIIGPSALITIKVMRCETQKQNSKWAESRFNYQTKQTYNVNVFGTTTIVHFKASIQTTDLTTGRIFSAKVYECSPSKRNASYEGYPEAPSEYDVQEMAFFEFKNDVHKLFFTWYEPTTLYFFDDTAGGLKEAFKALKSGDLKNALELSFKNLETCKSDPKIKPKILAHAYYNMGMSYFIFNEYDKAIEYFKESEKLRPGSIVTNAIGDCEKARALNAELQRVEEHDAAQKQQLQSQTETDQKVAENSTLKNDDIIMLTQRKLPDSLIIQKIKTSTSKFDMSTDAMIKLTEAGVSEEVIIEMMSKK